MAKKKTKKLTPFGATLLVLAILGLLLAIAGLIPYWVNSQGTLLGVSKSVGKSLSDLVADNAKLAGTEFFNSKIPTMQAFMILTLVGSALSFVLYLVRRAVKFPLSGILTLAFSLLTIVSAVVMLSVTGSYCASLTGDFYGLIGAKTTMGLGPWLMGVGGIVTGGSVLLGTLAKK